MTENTDTSGGTRFSAGKPGSWWTMPLYGLTLIAPVSEDGGKKYAPLDWAIGQNFSTLFNSMMRHILKAQQFGIWARDEESGHYHMAHAAWNILCLLTFMALDRTDLDDMTKWRGVSTAEKQVMESAPEPGEFSGAVGNDATGKGLDMGVVWHCPGCCAINSVDMRYCELCSAEVPGVYRS